MSQKQKLFLKTNVSKGFTLLELLLSIGILALLVMILGGAFHLVIRSWEKGENEVEEFRKTRIVLDRIADQIKSTYPYWAQREKKWVIAFQGETHSLKFVSPLAIQSPFISGLVWVQYFLKDEGSQEKKFLVRETRVTKDDFFSEGREKGANPGLEVALLSDIEDLTFEYFSVTKNSQAGEWRNEWIMKEQEEGDEEEGPQLPLAIRVTLKHKSQKTGEEPVTTAMTIPLIALPDKEIGFANRKAGVLNAPGEGPPPAAYFGAFPRPGQNKNPPDAVPPFLPYPATSGGGGR